MSLTSTRSGYQPMMVDDYSTEEVEAELKRIQQDAIDPLDYLNEDTDDGDQDKTQVDSRL